MSNSEWPTWIKANALRVNALLSAVSLFFIPLDCALFFFNQPLFFFCYDR